MEQTIYTLCGMCSVRCPIKCTVEDGKLGWIEGNPLQQDGALCGKGSAGITYVYDEVRPEGPMIRQGRRGGGQWKRVGWEEALDYTAEKLDSIIKRYGAPSIFLSCRGGPFQDLPKTFLRALGSPNFTNHDANCGRNVHHASQSVTGLGRKGFGYDIAKAKHLVVLGRNLLESMKVKEARDVMKSLKRGMRMTVIDVRATVTGSKATRAWIVKPGSDYALLQAIVHEVLKTGAYDKAFVEKYATGLDYLQKQVADCTPEWAANQTGVSAKQIRAFVKELDEDRPKVIFHPGWMFARYQTSFYTSRMLHILNVLMGNLEIEGGQIYQKTAKDYGKKELNTLIDRVPPVKEKRADGVGWKYKHFDSGPGLFQLFYPAIMNDDPYPLRGYILYRHDPLVCFPDREAQLTALEKLEFIVSIDAKFGETTWYSDVILPNASYLEKATPIILKKGGIPYLTRRQKVIDPVHDSKPEWWIFRELAKRLGFGKYYPYETVEELWDFQLEGTGIKPEDFLETGFVPLAEEKIQFDRENLPFKTPTGKIEFDSEKLKEAGFESVPKYTEPAQPEKGEFRLVFGRHAIHAHAHTQNNPYLHEVLPTNNVWINTERAKELGIKSGDRIDISCRCGPSHSNVKALVTDAIHPEAAFTFHGFGRTVPLLKRAYGEGFADQRLCRGKLNMFDPVGGAIANQETFVTITKRKKSILDEEEEIQ